MSLTQDSLPEWQCEKCNLYSPATSAPLFLWCTQCEQVFCALCIGECNRESHPWTPASEIIHQLKSNIIFTKADMATCKTSVNVCGVDILRTIHGLSRNLTELEKRYEDVSNVIEVFSDELAELQNAADVRRAKTSEHLPFSSGLVRKLRAEIRANKILEQDASVITLLFNGFAKQSDAICKDAHILSDSFLLGQDLISDKELSDSKEFADNKELPDNKGLSDDMKHTHDKELFDDKEPSNDEGLSDNKKLSDDGELSDDNEYSDDEEFSDNQEFSDDGKFSDNSDESGDTINIAAYIKPEKDESKKSDDVNAFGDMTDESDGIYEDTVCEATHYVVREDNRLEDSENDSTLR